MQKDPPQGISASPNENNLMAWNAVIFGPEETVWDGDVPPKQYVGKGASPNRGCAVLYADGQICLDILQNQWSPIYDVSAILTSIQSLLCDPNPNSPANSEAAKLFSEDKREYNRRVKEVVEESWMTTETDDKGKDKK
eukprot:scaffold840_cov344-Pavlova_lutheri.AAC.37